MGEMDTFLEAENLPTLGQEASEPGYVGSGAPVTLTVSGGGTPSGCRVTRSLGNPAAQQESHRTEAEGTGPWKIK